jgi:short-subunit dehydrogenase
LDILICNAGVGYGGSIAEMDIDRIREIYEVNVFNNVYLIQVVLKNMIKKDSGKVIIMSSLAGLMTIPFIGAYASSKSSLKKIAQTLKAEVSLISKGVTIHLIEPGMYKTGFNEVMLESKYDKMSVDSYFKEQINIIRKRENLFWGLLQKRSLNSITRQIVNCIESGDRFIYSAPALQRFFAKLFSLLND